MNQLIETIEAERLNTNLPDFKVGDTISVHYRIIEGNKERVQIFTGTVIARKGKGISETVAIYRIAYGSAMERIFPIHSPKVAKIEIVKQGKVRKGKLYYLRGIFGKKAKIKEKIVGSTKEAIVKETPKAVEEAPKKTAVETKKAAKPKKKKEE